MLEPVGDTCEGVPSEERLPPDGDCGKSSHWGCGLAPGTRLSWLKIISRFFPSFTENSKFLLDMFLGHTFPV